MADEVSFEHASTFEQGEISGNVRLGKLEAHYSEMVADAIEDGVITRDERKQLNRAADALGLDKERLRSLEKALLAVYESRTRVKVVERKTTIPPPMLPDMEPGPMSLMPLQPAQDPHTQALERRVHALEARIAELEGELAAARAEAAIEVDLSGVSASPSTSAEEEPSAIQRRIAHDPRDLVSLRALYRAYAKTGANADRDRAWCVAHALSFLDAADEEQCALYTQYKVPGLIRPATSLAPEGWRRLLFHPDEEPLTGEIFAVIVSAVLLGRVSALKRDKALPKLDPSQKQDPQKTTIQAVRCFSWSASILGMTAPSLFVDPSFAGIVEMVPGMPPVTRLGQKALSGRSPLELAFAAGRHLAWYREERFVRLLIPPIADLEDLFLAALLVGSPGIPLKAEAKQRVLPLAQAIEPVLEPLQIDRLRGAFLRFVEEGGRTNLQRWATAADKTASRTGLLLANDLTPARAMLELEDYPSADDKTSDLIAFVVSDRYASLRKQLGIAIPAA